MGDELRCFPRKTKFLPVCFFQLFTVSMVGVRYKHTIQFSAFELAGVVLKLRLYGKTGGIEGSPPRIHNATRMCQLEREP